MNSGHRELRFGSVVSTAMSSLIALYVAYRFASTVGSWNVVTTQEKVLWSLAFAGGFALITSSVLHTATDSKRIGVSHGVLMAIAASAISIFSIHSLVDLQSHPRGGFVEMAAVPMLGGLLIFGILAGGSALQTLFHATKKRPNQSPQRNAGAGPAIPDEAPPPHRAAPTGETARPQPPRG